MNLRLSCKSALNRLWQTLLVWSGAFVVSVSLSHAADIELQAETEAINQQILQQHLKLPSDLDNSARIEKISEWFKGNQYVANRLIGSVDHAEQMVVDMAHVDCFTYLDYVEALRLSYSSEDFFAQLKTVRYQAGKVDFLSRHHFFSDWVTGQHRVRDITVSLTPKAQTLTKQLNQSANGQTYITGLIKAPRTMSFIASQDVDSSVIEKLKTGDYIGIYTPIAGLDVTHVGIFIRTDNGAVLRHASSQAESRRVVDSPFMDYIRHKAGIVVYRSF